MRLSELETGQVWLLENPQRIGRIGNQTIVEIPTMTSIGGDQVPDIEERPAFEVTVTLADKPIEGMHSDEAADMTATLKTSLQNTTDAVKGDIWIEVWCERAVPTVKTPEGSIAKILERTPILQLYCAESRGRQSKHERTSPVANCEVSGKLVPPALVSPAQFEGLIRGSKGVVTPQTVSVRQCEGCGVPLERGVASGICGECRARLQSKHTQSLDEPSVEVETKTEREELPRGAPVNCPGCGAVIEDDRVEGPMCAKCLDAIRLSNEPDMKSQPDEPVLPKELPCVVCNEPTPLSELMKRHHSKTGICDSCRRKQIAKKARAKPRTSKVAEPESQPAVEAQTEPEPETANSGI